MKQIPHAGAALALHGYLREHHLRDGLLVGPDSGIRVNYRVGRFIKSYTRHLPWRDDLCYLQAQGYWTLSNWDLHGLIPEDGHDALALACSEQMIGLQRADGAWEYPNREWGGRVANAEGSWAAIGLIESYRQTGGAHFLEAALRWYRYLDQEIGWRPALGGIASNYFADRPWPAVPNNTAFVLRLLAELADATDDQRFLRRRDSLMTFLEHSQWASGEMPYHVSSPPEEARHDHFQCFQYAAFQTLDLLRYHQLTGDERALTIAGRMMRFLADAVDEDGAIPYACGEPFPRVTYHLAADSAALQAAGALGLVGCADAGDRVRARLLSMQRADGGFEHSARDYGFLHDRRSYPRNLSMILLHLLATEAGLRIAFPIRSVA